jgi:hydrogenase maturation protease
MSPAPASVLVLGLGNDILTDDAVGLRVAAAVRTRLADDPRIEVRATTEMGLALLDEIAGRNSLILVDAIQTGAAPAGRIHETDPGAFTGPLSTVPHFLGLRETLALGALLDLPMPREVRIIAIEVTDPFTLGTEPTPAVAAAVAPAADRVAALARALAAALPAAPA